MRTIPKSVAVAAAAVMSLSLAACGGSSSSGGAGGSASAAEEILAMPEIDDSDGLVIGGEKVADADLLKAARKEGSVAWYTASGAESAEVTAARFEAETGVKVKMTRMPSGKLAERVLSESGAGRLDAGVVTITDPVIAEEFASKGVYAPYKVASYDTVSKVDGVVYEDGLYYAPYYSAYAFSYNNQVVKEADAPKDWADLTDPKWKGKVGIVHAGAGGTVQGLAQFQEERLGKDYWGKLAALKPRIFDTTSTQLEALARGEIHVATSGFNSTYGAEIAGAPITLVVPPGGVSGTYNMQGVTKAGLDSAAAKLFQDWSMSSSGQQFAAAQGFVAARTDIPATKTGDYTLPTADSPDFELYTPEDARELGADIVARWNKAYGYGG
ncbi:extracellular solute-binding protein [Aeromicrobium sp. SMF47]|uniref:Extracellular solute-binding protein n=1 Tax=Aeromicrobium yanjiei TaxID=2662028 RepID=A0A5Q2MBV8_9ACTN|nr:MULTISPECIES: ABC transporter substrate-binding protein [Aeromicrobium]MRJ75532.1 extracellular solute-binding protein [Aeromicrobium yanjiei]MRK02444.1 extracellular solute-binding protein [Aeromicrobium sp. S22]QGG40048.1 extracellular solute-binding protein [Aeromicrobium yanjiei]